jgi:hypothetical protein
MQAKAAALAPKGATAGGHSPTISYSVAMRRVLASALLILLVTRGDALPPLVAPSLAGALKALDTPDDQRLRDEAALLLLRTPGLRPFVPSWTFRDEEAAFRKVDSLTSLSGFRDNWWCAFAVAEPDTRYLLTPKFQHDGQQVSKPQRVLHSDATPRVTPAFLTADDRQRAIEEWRALEQIDNGPNELGRRVLDWAQRNPTDRRVPEALHRIVRATRFGCTTEATGAISRSAFQLLHARYPKSPWAARTPHWFK